VEGVRGQLGLRRPTGRLASHLRRVSEVVAMVAMVAMVAIAARFEQSFVNYICIFIDVHTFVLPRITVGEFFPLHRQLFRIPRRVQPVRPSLRGRSCSRV